MTHRYPEDVNDAAGTNVETNNARLVDDEGNRVLPAVRVPQDSDPCCAEVINAPAKQLRDRLALLESKVPLLDEAAKTNIGDLAIGGNFSAGCPIVDTLQPNSFVSSEPSIPAMAELAGIPKADAPIALSFEDVEYVARNQSFYREGESGAFAMIDGSNLVWLEVKDGEYIPPVAVVVLSYTIDAAISATTKLSAPKIEADTIVAHTKGGTMTAESPLHAQSLSCDAIQADEINADVLQAGTIAAQSDGGTIAVTSPIESSAGIAVTDVAGISTPTLDINSGTATIDTLGDIKTIGNIEAGENVTAQKFVGPGVLKGLGFITIQHTPTGTGSYATNGVVVSGWNIQSVAGGTFSVSGVTQSCTAILLKLTGSEDDASFVATSGMTTVTVSSTGRFSIAADGLYLVIIV